MDWRPPQNRGVVQSDHTKMRPTGVAPYKNASHRGRPLQKCVPQGSPFTKSRPTGARATHLGAARRGRPLRLQAQKSRPFNKMQLEWVAPLQSRARMGRPSTRRVLGGKKWRDALPRHFTTSRSTEAHPPEEAHAPRPRKRSPVVRGTHATRGGALRHGNGGVQGGPGDPRGQDEGVQRIKEEV